MISFNRGLGLRLTKIRQNNSHVRRIVLTSKSNEVCQKYQVDKIKSTLSSRLVLIITIK